MLLLKQAKGNISIHAPRVGGDPLAFPVLRPAGREQISIHAPRVGGDPVYVEQEGGEMLISIHAPRVGGDGKNS